MLNEKDTNGLDLRIIIIGTSGTGKTSLVKRWMKGTFNESRSNTIISEFDFKVYEYNGKLYKVQCWDIGGQDRNVNISRIFMRKAQGSIFVCDITDERTMDDTLKWKKAVDEEANRENETIISVLVQNKIDLMNEEELKDCTKEEDFVRKNGFMHWFRTSCKNGFGVNECFDCLIRSIIENNNIDKNGKSKKDKEKETHNFKIKNKNNGYKIDKCCNPYINITDGL